MYVSRWYHVRIFTAVCSRRFLFILYLCNIFSIVAQWLQYTMPLWWAAGNWIQFMFEWFWTLLEGCCGWKEHIGAFKSNESCTNVERLMNFSSSSIIEMLDKSPPELYTALKIFLNRCVPDTLRPYIWSYTLQLKTTTVDVVSVWIYRWLSHAWRHQR